MYNRKRACMLPRVNTVRVVYRRVARSSIVSVSSIHSQGLDSVSESEDSDPDELEMSMSELLMVGSGMAAAPRVKHKHINTGETLGYGNTTYSQLILSCSILL